MRTVVLGNVLESARSGFACGEDPTDGVFQIRMNNVTADGRLDFTKQRRVPATTRGLGAYLLERGDVLFNMTNSPELVGKSAYFDGHSEPTVFSNHFLRMRPDRRALEPRFLARWLNLQFDRGVFKGMCRQWVNQATVSRESLLTKTIELPPIDEQRRIIAILDKADELRAKRRAGVAHLDSLSQSIFLDMFGDPGSANVRWPASDLGTLVSSIDSGASPVCHSRPATGEEWGVLKLGAVTWCEYDDSEHKALPAEIPPLTRNEVLAGDVLFARKNTLELIGATAYVERTRPRLLLSDLIFRLRLRPDAAVTPRYLQQLLITPAKREQVRRFAGGSAGSMPNISKARLAKVGIEMPPLELQREFDRRVVSVRSALDSAREEAAVLDQLFASLRHRGFSGAL